MGKKEYSAQLIDPVNLFEALDVTILLHANKHE